MGYVGKRNPLVRGFHDDLDQSVQRIRYDLDTFQNQVTNQGSFSVIGISGVGKTWMIKRILNTYPQAIRHCQYKDRQLSMFQLVWLMLQTPHDGSIKALARQFFIEVDNLLGTQYTAAYAGPRVTAEDMLVSMARLAGLLNLGVLVIDEIQTLVKSKGGKEQILSFLLQLDNQLGLPIVLVGTPQASALFEKNLRLARRFLGDSAAIFSRMRKDKEWESFVSGLWQYQYTFNKIPLTRSLTDTLYERTQGITSLVVKLYALAQVRAIESAARPEDEILTSNTINSVAADTFQRINPILERIRHNEPQSLLEYEDLYLPSLDQFVAESLR